MQYKKDSPAIYYLFLFLLKLNINMSFSLKIQKKTIKFYEFLTSHCKCRLSNIYINTKFILLWILSHTTKKTCIFKIRKNKNANQLHICKGKSGPLFWLPR